MSVKYLNQVQLPVDPASNMEAATKQYVDNSATGIVLSNVITGTTYTVAAADDGKEIQTTNSSAITITVNASTLTPNTMGLMCQYGTGQISVTNAAGTTMLVDGLTSKSGARYATMYWRCDSSSQVRVGGRVASS